MWIGLEQSAVRAGRKIAPTWVSNSGFFLFSFVKNHGFLCEIFSRFSAFWSLILFNRSMFQVRAKAQNYRRSLRWERTLNDVLSMITLQKYFMKNQSFLYNFQLSIF